MRDERTALDVERGVGAGGVHAHLPNVRVAAVEMILNDGELQGEAVDAAAALAEGDTVRGGSCGGDAETLAFDDGRAALLLRLAFEFAAAETDSATVAWRDARAR